MPYRFAILLLIFVASPLIGGAAEPFVPPLYKTTPAVESAYRLFQGQEIPNPTGESLQPDGLRAELWYAGEALLEQWELMYSGDEVKKIFVDLPNHPDVRVAFMDATENAKLRAMLTGDTRSMMICSLNLLLDPAQTISENPEDLKQQRFQSHVLRGGKIETQVVQVSDLQFTLTHEAPFEIQAEKPIFSVKGGSYEDRSLLLEWLNIRLPQLKEKSKLPVTTTLKRGMFMRIKRWYDPPEAACEKISVPSQLIPPGVVMLVGIPAKRTRYEQPRHTIWPITYALKRFSETGSIVVMVSNQPLPTEDFK